MKLCKIIVKIAPMCGLCVLTGCASFFSSDGGGALKLDQTGDWAGVPPKSSVTTEQLRSTSDRLMSQKDNVWAGRVTIDGDSWKSWQPGWIDPRNVPFLPAHEMRVAQDLDIWSRLIPSVRIDQRLYYKQAPGCRKFCGFENEWGCGMLVGDFIACSDQCDAYDVATGERVAAQKRTVILSLLGYARERRILPVGKDGREGLYLLSDPTIKKSDVLWNVKDGTTLLGGILGWGTVNHKKYIQLLFIPISSGTVQR